MKSLPLSQGLVALVDDADFDRLNAFKWSASLESRGTKIYAIRWSRKSEHGNGKRYKIRLHHAVLRITPADLPPGYVVDHISHDSLDCRWANLEIITQHENMLRSAGWKRKGDEPWL